MKLSSQTSFFSVATMLTAIVMVCASFPSAFADHNEATKDYPRVLPPTQINNDPNSPIQVKYLDEISSSSDQILFKPSDPLNIEFQTSFEVSTVWCITHHDGVTPYMTCTLYGAPPHPDDSDDRGNGQIIEDCTQQGLVYDHELDTCVTAQDHEDSAKINYMVETATEEIPKTQIDIWIERYEDKFNPTTEDTRTLELLYQLDAVCIQGEGRSAAIQEHDTFDIPVEEYIDPETGETKVRLVDDNSIKAQDFRGIEGLIMRNIDRCIAQSILEADVLSDVDQTYADAENFPQPHHSDVAQFMDPISASELESMENEGKIEIHRFNPICQSDYYSERTKSLFDCPGVVYEDADVPAPEMKDYGQSDPMLKLHQWKQDPDAAKEEIKKENLRKYQERTR